jgi:hypothetical protein
VLTVFTCQLIVRKHNGMSDFKNGLKTVVCGNFVTKYEISRNPCKLKVYVFAAKMQ